MSTNLDAAIHAYQTPLPSGNLENIFFLAAQNTPLGTLFGLASFFSSTISRPPGGVGHFSRDPSHFIDLHPGKTPETSANPESGQAI